MQPLTTRALLSFVALCVACGEPGPGVDPIGFGDVAGEELGDVQLGEVPDASQMDAAEADSEVPDTWQMDTAEADSEVPDTLQMDTLQNDSEVPDTSQMDTSQMDAADADAEVPNAEVPDTSQMDAADADAEVPDTLQMDAPGADAEVQADSEAPDALQSGAALRPPAPRLQRHQGPLGDDAQPAAWLRAREPELEAAA